MNNEMIKAISEDTRKLVREMATAAGIEAFDQKGKNVTGRTIRSVFSEVNESDDFLSVTTKAGEGAKYIVEGKPANTKMPVRKVAGRFELVPRLKEWKQAVGATMPDYLLARSIARNKRDPIDIPATALDIWLQKYQPIAVRLISRDLMESFASELYQRINQSI